MLVEYSYPAVVQSEMITCMQEMTEATIGDSRAGVIETSPSCWNSSVRRQQQLRAWLLACIVSFLPMKFASNYESKGANFVVKCFIQPGKTSN